MMLNNTILDENEAPRSSVQRKPWSAPLVIVSMVKLETSKSTTADPIDHLVTSVAYS